jgi:hypothetical protein
VVELVEVNVNRYLTFSLIVPLLLATLTAAYPQARDRQIVRIRLGDPEQIHRLDDLNLDFVSEAVTDRCDIVVTDEELVLIRARGFSPEIVVPKDAELAIPPEYHSYEETFQVFDSLRALYPDIVHLDTVGYTHWRSLPIYGIRISDQAASEEDEPAVLLTGVTHAREPLGNEIIIYLAEYLCTNYASSPQVRRWVDSLEIWLIPIVNVDGFLFVFDSATTYPYWRKNQHDNNNNGRFDRNYDGVDLNRNFDWRWTSGGSTNPPDETYRGPAGGSESEVQTWCRLALRHRPAFGISYHSYGALVIYPWRFQSQATPDEDVLAATAQRMAQLIGYTVSTSSGSNQSEDWLYARAGQLDVLIETALNEFIPRAESIPVICRQNFRADTFLLNRMFYAGIWGHVRDAVTDSPLVAQVQMLGRVDTNLSPRTTDSVFGRFHRALVPGTYNLRFIAPGYETETLAAVPVVNDSLTHVEVRMHGPTGVVERPVAAPLSPGTGLHVPLTPFVSFTRIPGAEHERFAVYDIRGCRVAICAGDRIGSNLAPGVYFIHGITPPATTAQVVKIR